MTARAWVVAATGLASAAVGLWLQWAVLLAVGVALLALLLVPLLLRRPSSARWTDLAAPTRVTRGEPAAVTIGITTSPGSHRWVSAVDDLATDRVFLPFSGTSGALSWTIDTSRRGLLHVGPSRLEARDPFGIAARTLASRTPSPILVVPRVRSVQALAALGTSEAEEAQERIGSETFHSLREYVVGDPQKLVHWKSSARAGRLMVRRMVDTTVPWLLVILDVNSRAYDRSGAMFEDFDSPAFEEAVDTAASWAWHGCGPEQRVLLTTTSVSQRSRHAPFAAEVTARTRASALDRLAVVDPLATDECGSGRIEALLRRQGVGRAVLVTGRRLDTSAGWVARWRRLAPVHVEVGHS